MLQEVKLFNGVVERNGQLILSKKRCNDPSDPGRQVARTVAPPRWG